MTTSLLVVDSLQDIIMPDALPPEQPRELPPLDKICADLLEWEQDFVEGHASATAKAVRADWQVFVAWCEQTRCPALPASMENLVRFLTDMVVLGRKAATVRRYVYTIRRIHRAADLPDPTKHPKWQQKWKALLKRLANAKRVAPRQAGPLQASHAEVILESLGDSKRDLRDAALISLASDTLCRESELAVVELKHFVPDPDTETGAWRLYVGYNKTDQEGLGSYRFVSGRTKSLVDRWCAAAGISSGPVFLPVGGRPKKRKDPDHPEPIHLRPAEIARILRRRAIAAGLPEAHRISGHSARVGSSIDLVEAGFSVTEAQYAGGWQSERMVRQYAKRALAGSNAMARLRAGGKRG